MISPLHAHVHVHGYTIHVSFNFVLLQTSFEFREWDSRKHVNTNPSLDYLAPEYILSQSCSQLSDVYSFGMLCYALYNQGKPLFENNKNMLTFKANVEQVQCTYQFIYRKSGKFR